MQSFYLDVQKEHGESGLVGLAVVVRIGRFPVQTPLNARPGLGTQPRHKAPGNLRVESVRAVIIIIIIIIIISFIR